MPPWLIKALDFFRITDDDGLLSLTHMALYVCIVKLAIASPASIADIGALFIAICNYGYKKWLGIQEPTNIAYAPEFQQKFEEMEQKIKEVQGKVSGVAVSQAMSPNGFR